MGKRSNSDKVDENHSFGVFNLAVEGYGLSQRGSGGKLISSWEHGIWKLAHVISGMEKPVNKYISLFKANDIMHGMFEEGLVEEHG